jgi:hypothetical protein
MKHLVLIHQKRGLPDLYDYYPSEQEAKEAVKAINEGAGVLTSVVLTPSGNATFRAADFGGATYKPDYSDELGSDDDS